MKEQLQQLDELIFGALNGAHCDYADSVMYLMSGKWAYALMVVAFLYAVYRRGVKGGALMVLAMALTVVLCDQVSSSLIKPLVCRLRPSHVEHLSAYVLNGYRGGMYGFVSSHAANSFGVAMLVSLIMYRRSVSIVAFLWAAFVSYSRIYLGVHYPGDIFCGAVLGVCLAAAVYKLLKIAGKKMQLADTGDEKAAKVMTMAICVNIAVILIVAAIFDVI